MIEINHQLKKFFLILFFGIVGTLKLCLIDQLSKWWIKSILITKSGYTISLTSFLNIVYSWNHGISFGMFREYHAQANKVFIVLNIIVVLYIVRCLFKSTSYGYFVGYGLIIGGAVGNLIDRLVHGAVFDFIDFHYNDVHFPAFNLADSFIFFGAIMILNEYRKAAKAVAMKKEEEYDAISAEADRIRQMDAEIAKKGINKNE